MAWCIYDENGIQRYGPYKNRSDAAYVLKDLQWKNKSNSDYQNMVISYIADGDVKCSGDERDAWVFGLIGGVLGLAVYVFNWLISTRLGKKFLLFLAIFIGVLYAMNAWENRAYTKTTYYENGNIKIEQSFKSKKLNGISKFYLENGKLEKEENYKNGELEGLSTEYYANGKPKSEQNYASGKLNGVSTFYLENGIKEKEQTYKDDVKNGSSKIYYPNGVLKSEAMISNNKLNGLSILYDEDGNILRKENFVNGKSTNIIE